MLHKSFDFTLERHKKVSNTISVVLITEFSNCPFIKWLIGEFKRALLFYLFSVHKKTQYLGNIEYLHLSVVLNICLLHGFHPLVGLTSRVVHLDIVFYHQRLLFCCGNVSVRSNLNGQSKMEHGIDVMAKAMNNFLSENVRQNILLKKKTVCLFA